MSKFIMVLEKTLESPLDSQEVKQVNPKGNQPWLFTGRTDAEAPILWPPDAKSWFSWNDPDAGKDWRQEEKRLREDEMVLLAYPIQWMCVWANSGRRWRTGKPGMLRAVHGVAKTQTQLSDWTTTHGKWLSQCWAHCNYENANYCDY